MNISPIKRSEDGKLADKTREERVSRKNKNEEQKDANVLDTQDRLLQELEKENKANENVDKLVKTKRIIREAF